MWSFKSNLLTFPIQRRPSTSTHHPPFLCIIVMVIISNLVLFNPILHLHSSSAGIHLNPRHLLANFVYSFFFFFFVCSTSLQDSIICWGRSCAADATLCVVMAGICNLAVVPAIAALLFMKNIGIFNILQLIPEDGGTPFNVNPRDGTRIDESPSLWNTRMTV